MRNRIVAGLTLLSFIGVSFPAVALQGAEKAQLEAQNGQVLVRSADSGWAKTSSQNLAPGQVIRTGKDGEAILGFAGGDRVRLAANSEMTLVSSDANTTQVYLHRGRLLGQASSALHVGTSKSETVATKGEFVLETDAKGAGLEVLGGDARLAALDNSELSYPMLGNLPKGANAEGLKNSSTGSKQSVGGYDQLAQKDKGTGQRTLEDRENVGGERDTAPDREVMPPRRETPPPVRETPPPQPPVRETPPPIRETPPPVRQTPPPMVKRGGSFLPFLLGAALLGTGLYFALRDDDDDDDDDDIVFVPQPPGPGPGPVPPPPGPGPGPVPPPPTPSPARL